MKRLLIFDYNNIFVRSYIVDPTLSALGVPVGGVVGALKTTQKIIREVKPDQIIVAWDGSGGSKRRKQTNKNYKEGRKPIRLNRFIKGTLSEDQESDNRIWQMTRLFEYASHMPIYQMIFDSVEADDIIAYVTQHEKYQDWQKVIVSSDKDFIQLLDNKTILYRPTQKEILNTNSVLERYNIHPNNFVVARACCGKADKSDGLSGAQGVGIKGVASRFPFLAESKIIGYYEIFAKCREEIEKKTKIKMYQKILENQSIIEENYKLMQLSSPSISIQTKQEIDIVLNKPHTPVAKTSILKMMVQDNILSFSWDVMYSRFNKILLEQNKKEINENE